MQISQIEPNKIDDNDHNHDNQPPENTADNKEGEPEILGLRIPSEPELNSEHLSLKSIDSKHITIVEEKATPTPNESVSEITVVSAVSSNESILTRITQILEEDLNRALPLCLLLASVSNSQIFEDNKFNFPRNVDPGISTYMDQVDTDEYTGWERYKRECFKYSMPRLTPLKDVLEHKTTELKLRVNS